MGVASLPRIAVVASAAVVVLLCMIAGSAQASPPVILTVDSTGDEADANPGDGECATAGGACTLRAAIQESNATGVAGRDISQGGEEDEETIRFNMASTDPNYEPLGGWYRIRPASSLPVVTDSVIIDATTQPGYGGTPIIWIDGSNVPGTTALNLIGVDESIVRGLSITGFTDNIATQPLEGPAVIFQTGSDNLVDLSWLGVDPEGNPDGNRVGAWGFGQDDFTVSNSVISNNVDGVLFQNSNDVLLTSTFVGTGADGDSAQGNTEDGVLIFNSTGTIGGPNPGDGNLISANGTSGITVLNSSSEPGQLIIDNNFIGTNSGGLEDLGNGGPGITFPPTDEALQYDRIEVNNTIISGNEGDGFDWFNHELPPDGLYFNFTRVGMNAEGDPLANAGLGLAMQLAATPDSGPLSITNSNFGYNNGSNIFFEVTIPDDVPSGSTVQLPITFSNVESVESGEDGLTFIARLRDDLFWSDGSRITWHDVRFAANALSGGNIQIEAPDGDSGFATIFIANSAFNENAQNGLTMGLFQELQQSDATFQFRTATVTDTTFNNNGGSGFVAQFGAPKITEPGGGPFVESIGAEYVGNGASGGVVNVITKSGGNDFSGSVFYSIDSRFVDNDESGLQIDTFPEQGVNDAAVNFEDPILLTNNTFSGNENGLGWTLEEGQEFVSDIVGPFATITDNTFDENVGFGFVSEVEAEFRQSLTDHWRLIGNSARDNGEGGVVIFDVVTGRWLVADNVLSGNGGPGLGVSAVGANRGRSSAATSGEQMVAVLSRNSIDGNGGPGIDLGSPGVTANDPDDSDSGPNGLLNFPVIESATPGSLAIAGSYDGLADTTVTLEFFASPACDTSGNGEGFAPIGMREIATNGAGHADFDFIIEPGAPAPFIAATATVEDVGTSEFSNCVEAPGLERTGDVDCDGAVDVLDFLALLQEVAGVDSGAGCLERGNMDCDGDMDAADAIRVILFVAGFPATPAAACEAARR